MKVREFKEGFGYHTCIFHFFEDADLKAYALKAEQKLISMEMY